MEVGNLIYVKPDPSESWRDDSDDTSDTSGVWIAQVLECRASSPSNVLLRICWIYRPQDLPMGRQPYHGRDELIPSNHMQIIDALSVDGKMNDDELKKFDESDDHGYQVRAGSYFWRQVYDCRTGQLSNLRKFCKCKAYTNPEQALIQCTNVKCRKWMHQQCLVDGAIIQAYNGEDAEALNASLAESTRDADDGGGTEEEPLAAAASAVSHIVEKITSAASRALGQGANGHDRDEQDEAGAERAKGGGAKKRGRASLSKTTPAKARPRATKEDEATLVAASKQFSAEVRRKGDKTAGEQEADDVERVFQLSVTDKRDEEQQRTWTRDIVCFFCSQKVT